ncbi:hypothetical protein VF14_31825 [Nostoc linckia z18]|uniref:Uncharacterized protein n=2 Tax=Nostoc linckia TaxID=92942 RepID=A0A9Q5Z5W5_NOSLI|nr:hypothetical protein [Nostoc linckia]PHK34614.1 hypothetical protein VF12_23575 [Nostoc linckia z15]PHK41177.1 hypothetical protein VF13_31680 [Nostoc linckia z16]PHJ55785.1 hypothetical protein VF02_35440 [Nostoc linckia z1]PHJ56999.1 hypothetical protein VF05_36460 [Nostoc linckia z3]PHJ58293.1 hypothetical protein VF03_35645 [Nostoc linckia z2]
MSQDTSKNIRIHHKDLEVNAQELPVESLQMILDYRVTMQKLENKKLSSLNWQAILLGVVLSLVFGCSISQFKFQVNQTEVQNVK